MCESDAGEPSLLALPYGWPSGEYVPVILTPVGPQGECWSLLPGNLLTWAFPLARPIGTLPVCARISTEAAWGLHSSLTLHRLQEMQPGVVFHWKSCFCTGRIALAVWG